MTSRAIKIIEALRDSDSINVDYENAELTWYELADNPGPDTQVAVLKTVDANYIFTVEGFDNATSEGRGVIVADDIYGNSRRISLFQTTLYPLDL